MRGAATIGVLLALSQSSYGQTSPVAAAPDRLIIHVSADMSCAVLTIVAPCDRIGAALRAAKVSPTSHLAVTVDENSQYEKVYAILNSLRDAGYSEVAFLRE